MKYKYDELGQDIKTILRNELKNSGFSGEKILYERIMTEFEKGLTADMIQFKFKINSLDLLYFFSKIK